MEKTLDHLDGLTDDEREVYTQGGDGRWHLHPDLAALVDEHAATLAALEEREKHLQATATRLAGRQAYRAALEAAGINGKLTEAATVLLMERAPVVLGDDGRADLAETEHGLLPVSSVVASFLGSEEGEGFAPKPKTTGPYATEIARLRSLH